MQLTESIVNLTQVYYTKMKISLTLQKMKFNNLEAKMQLRATAHGLILILLKRLKILLDLGQTKLWIIKQTKQSIS